MNRALKLLVGLAVAVAAVAALGVWVYLGRRALIRGPILSPENVAATKQRRAQLAEGRSRRLSLCCVIC